MMSWERHPDQLLPRSESAVRLIDRPIEGRCARHGATAHVVAARTTHVVEAVARGHKSQLAATALILIVVG
jgi:hypothetical protein